MNREVPHNWTVGALLERKANDWRSPNDVTDCDRETIKKIYKNLRLVLDLAEDPKRKEEAFDMLDNTIVDFPDWAKED